MLCIIDGAFGASTIAAENSKPDIFDRKIRGDGAPVQMLYCDLTDIIPGEVRHVSIFLKNDSDTAIDLDSVETSCGCTKASVPKGVLEPGKSVHASFRISSRSQPNKLEDDFDVSIRGRGDSSAIRIRLHAKYKNYVFFRDRDFSHVYSKSDKRSHFRLAVLCSNLQLLEGAKIETSKELKSLKSKLVIGQKNAEVLMEFETSLFGEDYIAGDVRLVRDGIELANARCLLLNRSGVEVHPSPIFFSPELDGSGGYIASVVVRFHDRDKSEEHDCKSIRCDSTDGLEFDTSLQRMAAGLYRVTIKATPKATSANKGKLSLSLETTSGEASVDTDFYFHE